MRESTLWILHIFAGIFILVLLSLHMGIMHLDTILSAIGLGGHHPVESASVFARSQQGFFMVTYIILLGTALYHGFYGFRNILFEFTLSASLEKTINWVFIFAGLGLFIYGTYVAIFVFLLKEATV